MWGRGKDFTFFCWPKAPRLPLILTARLDLVQRGAFFQPQPQRRPVRGSVPEAGRTSGFRRGSFSSRPGPLGKRIAGSQSLSRGASRRPAQEAHGLELQGAALFSAFNPELSSFVLPPPADGKVMNGMYEPGPRASPGMRVDGRTARPAPGRASAGPQQHPMWPARGATQPA